MTRSFVGGELLAVLGDAEHTDAFLRMVTPADAPLRDHSTTWEPQQYWV